MHGRRRIASEVVRTLPLALGLAACGIDSPGPDGSLANLAITPVFNTAGGAAAAGIVEIARTRVRLVHEDGTLTLDSVIVVAPGADSVALEAQVRVASPTDGFQLTVAFITPEGDTAFIGGPVLIRPGQAPGGTVSVDLPTTYVGVGADAAGVRITTARAFLLPGDSITLAAEAFDAQDQVIPGTPIAWSSLDPALAVVPNPATGLVVAGTGAGGARIVAALLTGPADTLTAEVGVLTGSGTVLVLSNYDNGNRVIRDSFPPYMSGFTFDTMDVSQQTPTVAFLQQYRLILLFEDGLFSNAKNVGDSVAAYVQAGGNLVIGTFYWQERSDNLEFAGTAASWGQLETLDPFFGPEGSEYRGDSLYLPSIVAHPMTTGVDSLWVESFHGGVTAKPGTTVLAEWSDACGFCEGDIRTPLLGYRIESIGQRIVGVTVAPQYPDYGGFGGDFYRLWANVLGWAIAGGPSSLGAASLPAGTPRAYPAPADRAPRVGGSRVGGSR